MSNSGSGYLELLEHQIDEFRTSHTTPGPLAIALFFLGFIVINHLIRMLFPSEHEGRQSDVNGVSHEEPKIDERDSRGQDQEDEDDGTGPKDLMRMMLFKNQFASNSRSSQILPNRFGSDSISDSLLGDTFSISSSSIAPHNPRRNILQNLRASDSRHQSSHHFHEISDRCSSSTTSI